MAAQLLRSGYLAAALVFAGLWLLVQQQRLQLGRPALLTGWLLFTLVLVLALFNLKKRLAMLPLGRSSTWLQLHAAFGAMALPLFWLHAGRVWPTGDYEQLLAGLFYAVSFTGIAGLILQRIYPKRLARCGVEIIYERIPGEIAELRQRARGLVLESVHTVGQDTLSRLYLESLDWYFRKPRFFLNHAVFGKRTEHWVEQRCASVRKYLTPDETVRLERLTRLAEHKVLVDFHYASQTIMKSWLLVHVPLAAGLIIVALWHLVLVHVYVV